MTETVHEDSAAHPPRSRCGWPWRASAAARRCSGGARQCGSEAAPPWRGDRRGVWVD